MYILFGTEVLPVVHIHVNGQFAEKTTIQHDVMEIAVIAHLKSRHACMSQI